MVHNKIDPLSVGPEGSGSSAPEPSDSGPVFQPSVHSETSRTSIKPKSKKLRFGARTGRPCPDAVCGNVVQTECAQSSPWPVLSMPLTIEKKHDGIAAHADGLAPIVAAATSLTGLPRSSACTLNVDEHAPIVVGFAASGYKTDGSQPDKSPISTSPSIISLH